jgi:hypothetical protein
MNLIESFFAFDTSFLIGVDKFIIGHPYETCESFFVVEAKFLKLNNELSVTKIAGEYNLLIIFLNQKMVSDNLNSGHFGYTLMNELNL